MYLVITNPGSGGGGGRKTEAAIKAYLDAKGVEYEIAETKAKGHARELAAGFGGGTIIAVGGDGTFHEVLNGINTEKCRLGFVPSGRGNDFAEAFGLSKKPTVALDTILNGEEIDIDYIKVGEDLRCLNVAGTGLDVSVLEGVENKKDTKFTYIMSLINCIRHFTPYELDVEANGQTTHYSCVMVGVCNGKQIGGGIKISPVSKFDDGKLDVIAMEYPKKGLMRALWGFVGGKHMVKPYTHHTVCEQVKITSPFGYPIELDGEIYRGPVLDCRIVKGGLRTFKPII